MIRKVAISHALREAFPESLGGLYTAEEFGSSEQKLEPIEVPQAQTVQAETVESVIPAHTEPAEPVYNEQDAEADAWADTLEQGEI